MRPDRLVVGEVREAESLDLLLALNSGLPGACSIHANSAREALAKLCTLPLLAGRNIDSGFVVPTVASCVDIVVFCSLERDGRRRVTEILAPTGGVTGGITDTVGGTIDACAIPTDPSSLIDFTSNGNFKRFGRRTLRFIGNTAKFGTSKR